MIRQEEGRMKRGPKPKPPAELKKKSLGNVRMSEEDLSSIKAAHDAEALGPEARRVFLGLDFSAWIRKKLKTDWPAD